MQIVYFPYLNMQQKEEYLFNDGDIKIWNFKLKGKDYIKDDEVYKKVQALVCSNIHGGKAIEDVGIVTIGKCDFREFSQVEMETVEELKYLFFVSHISNNAKLGQDVNAGHYAYTSENFDLVIQNFRMDNDYFGLQDGFIVNMLIGGYQIGKKKFETPTYLLKPDRVSFDGHLLKALLELKNKKPMLFKRIVEATKIFYLSYYNTPSLSQSVRIPLQTSAFEVLLKIPNKEKRKHFRESIEKLCSSTNEKQITFWSEAYTGKTRRKGTPKAYWADRFYTLRNHIIHGDKVKPKEYLFRNKQHYFDASLLFFILTIKRLANNALKEKLFYDDIKWEKKKDGFGRDFEGFVYEDNYRQAMIEKALANRN